MDVSYLSCFPVKSSYPGSFHPNVIKAIEKHKEGYTASIPCGQYKQDFNIDINPDVKPDIVGDVKDILPGIKTNKFDTVISDPPYSLNQALKLYNGKHISLERWFIDNLMRIAKKKVIYLHWYIAHPKRPFTIEKIYLCDHGGFRRVRALTILVNKENTLPF